MDRSTRVLIVDDHPLIANALRLLLEDTPDLTVVGVAENAADAVRCAAELHPDVVVMDSHLPGASGAEAAASIRVLAPTTAILFLSADDSDSAILGAVEAGASGYLNKGSRPGFVPEAVRRVAAGEMLVPAAVLARLINSRLAATMTSNERERKMAEFTEREREVLGLMGEGQDNTVIAAGLFIEVTTVRWHVRNILDKLNAHSKLEAVARAAQLGLLQR